MNEKPPNFDPAWGEIDSIASEVAEFEGGKHYKQNTVNLLVLNGTYYEMGRQYGHLLKEQIHWHLGELRKEFLEEPVGVNPKGHPAPLMSYDELKGVILPGFEKAKPYGHKQMVRGAAETSGLSYEDMTMMDHMLQVVIYSAGVTMCTSAACWGGNSKDGRLYTGRNHDFGKPWRDRLATAGVMVVMNRTGADISVAYPTRVGQVTTAIDLMNSKGLYVEFNNSDTIRPSALPTRMAAMDNVALQLMENYTSVDELDVIVPQLVSNDALLMLAADPTQARYFELSPDKCVATNPELANGQMTSRANIALSPEWGRNPDDYPERAVAFSRPRRDHFVDYLSADPSKNDDAAIRRYLNKEIAKDGQVGDGSAAILESFIGLSAEYTAYQTVTIPEERKMFWRIPTHTPWLEFDLKEYFANS